MSLLNTSVGQYQAILRCLDYGKYRPGQNTRTNNAERLRPQSRKRLNACPLLIVRYLLQIQILEITLSCRVYQGPIFCISSKLTQTTS